MAFSGLVKGFGWEIGLKRELLPEDENNTAIT